MVRLATPVAINRADSALDSQAGETAETLERRIQAEYDKALDQERSGNKFEAQVPECTTTHYRYTCKAACHHCLLRTSGFVQAAVG